MTEPAIGVIGLPGAWSTETLADAVEARTGTRLVIDMADVSADLAVGSVTCGDADLTALDAVIVKKIDRAYGPEMFDRLDILRYLEGRGVRVVSRPAAIAGMVSRLGCTAVLRAHDIPMPATVVTEDLGRATAAVRGFGEAVVKPLFSTKARGMELLRGDDPELVARLSDYRDRIGRTLYLQQRLALPDRDYGIVFLGGRYLASYARVRGDGAWSTTTREGGHYEGYQPPEEVVALAERAQRPFGLDYTSVDVAETEAGYVVFEVSAFGGFRGLHAGCGVDVAPRIVEYVIDELST